MTRKQITFLLVWLLVLAVLVLSIFVSPLVLIVAVVVAGLVVSMFQKSIVPVNSTPKTPMEVLEQSLIWKGIAAVYVVALTGTVVYHLTVDRIGLFEDAPFALLILLMFGPALGPIVVCQLEIYRLLGKDRSQS